MDTPDEEDENGDGYETSNDIFENLWSVLDNLLVCRFHLCLDEIYFLPGLHHGFP